MRCGAADPHRAAEQESEEERADDRHDGEEDSGPACLDHLL
jgi:hypothetical protein